MSIAAEPEMIDAGMLADLQAVGVKVVHGADRPIAVYFHDGQVHAVDNRCPHMGFPLHKGTITDGILTCHWHHARFDLCSGCTFDLFADDVPAYETRLEAGRVFVSTQPRVSPDRDYYLRRLGKGLQQNIRLIQAKSLIGLSEVGASHREIATEAALFASRNSDSFGDGLVTLAIVGRLRGYLSPDTGYFASVLATQRVAANAAGATPRRLREPLDTDAHSLETLKRWLRRWILSRHRDGIERVLLTAVRCGASEAELTDLIYTAVTDRVFSNTGHTLDFANKLIELIGQVGPEHAEALVPLLTAQMANARGGEESAAWHHPVEIIGPLNEATERIPELLERGRGKTWHDDGSLDERLLGEDAPATIDALATALGEGAPPAELAKRVAWAAAMRLARFAITNDVADWFNPQHTFNYANAVHQGVKRSPTPGVIRGIFHGAMAVYMDRFLNVPAARLPGQRGSLDTLPSDGDELRRNLLDVLDQRVEVDAAARTVARYVRRGHPIEPLIETLVYATVREDVDFHPLQVLEAGVQQYHEWPTGSPQAEQIMVGVVRQLAAFCPTRRGGLQIATIALRLHRGQKVYEDEEEGEA